MDTRLILTKMQSEQSEKSVIRFSHALAIIMVMQDSECEKREGIGKLIAEEEVLIAKAAAEEEVLKAKELIKLVKENSILRLKSTKNGATLLHLAIECNFVLIAKLLIEKGADVNSKDDDNATPLHYAVKTGNTELVYLLCYNNETVLNHKDIHGRTALDYAVIVNQPKCIKVLLRLNPINEADKKTAKGLIDTTDLNGTQKTILADAFTVTINQYKNTPLQKVVINKPPVDKRQPVEEQQLAEKMWLAEVKMHLNLGAPVDEQDTMGNSVLHYVVEKGYCNILDMLFPQGINVNLVNKSENTALHVIINAIINALYESTKSKKTDPEPINTLIDNSKKCIKRLITANIDVLAKNKDGKTAEELIESGISGTTLREGLYSAIYDIQSQVEKRKISDESAKEFVNLYRRYPCLELRHPGDFIQANIIESRQAACAIKAIRGKSTLVRKDTANSAQGDDSFSEVNRIIMNIHAGKVNVVISYLQNNGDPDLAVKPDNKRLIIHAIDCQNTKAVLELLRHGAKLDANEISRTDSNKVFLLDVMPKLAINVKQIKSLVDRKIEQENQKFYTLISKTPGELNPAMNKSPINTSGDDCDRLIIDICNVPLPSDLNQGNNNYSGMTGLLSLYSPHRILKNLIKLLPDFSINQKLKSFMLIQTLLLHRSEFKYDLSEFDSQLSSYFSGKNDDISKVLRNIFIHTCEFNEHPAYKGYLTLKNITREYGHINASIESKIDESVLRISKSKKDKSKKDKSKKQTPKNDIGIISQFLGEELVRSSVRFYHDFTPGELSSIKNVSGYVSSLDAFVQCNVLRQNSSENRKKVMTIFINAAQACLTNGNIVDFNSTFAILNALNNSNITRLKIALDESTIKLFNDLKKVVSPDNNYSVYRELTIVYQGQYLPSFEILLSDLAELNKDNSLTLEKLDRLGHIYQPLIALKERPDLYVFNCKSDLNYQLYSRIRDTLPMNLSLKIQPAFPDLSKECNIPELRATLEDMGKYKLPLKIRQNGVVYKRDEALDKFSSWINDKMRKKVITCDEATKIYNAYQLYNHNYNLNNPERNSERTTTSRIRASARISAEPVAYIPALFNNHLNGREDNAKKQNSISESAENSPRTHSIRKS